jgi:acyl-CoA reductase-like NAD-dependent aldehyde dehydrogenase
VVTVVHVDHGMDCMREETFGPTLPVMRVRDAQEAIERANDSRFGLSGSVWTRDKAKAMAGRRMKTGTVQINNVILSVLQLPVPFAGWKDWADSSPRWPGCSLPGTGGAGSGADHCEIR